MRLPRLLVLLSLFCCGLALAQSAPSTYSIVAANSKVTYDVVHPLHKVHGVSTHAEGRALIRPTGQAQVAVRIAADSFDSGNVNRDAHVKEVIEVTRFPQVELKAAVDGLTLPTTFPATVNKTFTAEISFHGVKKKLDLPITLTFESADRVRAQASLSLSMDEFKIERPSLMFKKVEDAMKIEADLIFAVVKG